MSWSQIKGPDTKWMNNNEWHKTAVNREVQRQQINTTNVRYKGALQTRDHGDKLVQDNRTRWPAVRVANCPWNN